MNREEQPRDRTILPPLDPPFRGHKRSGLQGLQGLFYGAAAGSRRRSNVLLIMGDDIGYGHMSALGRPANTPVFDHVAQAGGAELPRTSTRQPCARPHAPPCSPGATLIPSAWAVSRRPQWAPRIPASPFPCAPQPCSKSSNQNGYGIAWIRQNPPHAPSTKSPERARFDRWPGGMGSRIFLRLLPTPA